MSAPAQWTTVRGVVKPAIHALDIVLLEDDAQLHLYRRSGFANPKPTKPAIGTRVELVLDTSRHYREIHVLEEVVS